MTAQYFRCPVVFAKKSMSSNISDHVYSAPVKSFTHGNQYNAIVSKEYLHPEDRILVIDDFLAMGEALRGLFSLVQQSGATLIGAGIAVEKAFQPGGAQLRSEGYRIESLARVAAMSEEGGVVFARGAIQRLSFRGSDRRHCRGNPSPEWMENGLPRQCAHWLAMT